MFQHREGSPDKQASVRNRAARKRPLKPSFARVKSQLRFAQDAQKPGPVLSFCFSIIGSNRSCKLVLEGSFSTSEMIPA